MLDFEDSADHEVYLRYEKVIDEFLNVGNPNVQPLNTDLLDQLNRTGIIKRESDTNEPGTALRIKPKTPHDNNQTEVLSEFFPAMHVPIAPSGSGLIVPKKKSIRQKTKDPYSYTTPDCWQYQYLHNATISI